MWRDAAIGAAIVLAAFAWVWGPVLIQQDYESTDVVRSASRPPVAAPQIEFAVIRLECAGEDSCNGDYRESGTYRGMPVYAGPGQTADYFIYFTGASWTLSAGLGDPMREMYYSSGRSLPGNPWSAVKAIAPAPTVSPLPELIIQGAGDPSYDGAYCSIGLKDGRECYSNGSKYLFWDAVHDRWAVADAPDTPTPAYANGGELPGRWIDDFARAPAPAVAGGTAAVEAAETDGVRWVIEGSGDSSYDGEYRMVAIYNGQPCYVCENEAGPRYLFFTFAFAEPCWALSDAICDAPTDGYLAKGGETALPANPWGVNLAQPPGPTVSAAPDRSEPSPAVTPSEE